MQKTVLPNGLTILYEKKERNSVVIEVMVKVGSNHETDQERGLAHFIEHLLFEGTASRPTNQEISNEIEKIGGEFNAYTTNERTCIYIKVLRKYLPQALDILADVLQHSLFKEEHIAKEKEIILREIDLINDEPGYYQWIFLQKHLFARHPARYPTYGEKKQVQAFTREQILTFFNRYYVPNNMVISIVGNVSSWKEAISKRLRLVPGPVPRDRGIKEPAATHNILWKEKKNMVNTYLVIGFKTVPRTHPDSSALEVINGILGRGQSGKLFTEIRSKRALAYDVGTQNISEKGFGYFAAYASIKKKNLPLVQKLILEELDKLQNITPRELQEAKTSLEGSYLLDMEETQKLADQLLYWELIKDARLRIRFLQRIQRVTMPELRRAAQKYFRYRTMVVLEGR